MRYSNIEETALYLSGVTKPANCLRYDAIFYIIPFFLFHLLSSQILSIIILKVGPFLSVVRSFTERGIISWLKNSYNLTHCPWKVDGNKSVVLMYVCISHRNIYACIHDLNFSANHIYFVTFLTTRRFLSPLQESVHWQATQSTWTKCFWWSTCHSFVIISTID